MSQTPLPRPPHSFAAPSAVFPAAPSRARNAALVALFALVALLYSVGMTRMGFEGNDERRYALVAKEIWLGEGAFVMHLMRDLYPDKPPLFFWAQAACYAATGGVSPGAARAPLFLSALLCVGFAYLAMRQLGGERTAIIGAALLALSFRFFWSGRIARLDTPMCAFVYAGYWASARLLFPRPDQDDSPAARWRWAMLAWASMGLAVLAKGPGPLPWLGSIFAFAAVRRDASVLRRHHMLAGAALMAAIVMVWFIPARRLGGHDYIGPMIGTHVIKRAFDVVRHDQPFWYFFLKIFIDGFPVSILLPAGLWWALRGSKTGGGGDSGSISGGVFDAGANAAPGRSPTDVFAAVWFLFTLVFFSLPAGKRGQYILPLYPAMAFLVARFIEAGVFGGDARALRILRRHLWPLVAGLTLAPALAAAVAFAWRGLGPESMLMEPVGKLLADFHAPLNGAVMGAALAFAFLCGAAGMVQLWRGRAAGAARARGAGGAGRALGACVVAVYVIYFFLFAYFMPLNRTDAVPRAVADVVVRNGFTMDQVGYVGMDIKYALYGPGVMWDLSNKKDRVVFFNRPDPLLVLGEAGRIARAGNLPEKKGWTLVAAWEAAAVDAAATDSATDPADTEGAADTAADRRLLLYASPAAAPPAFALDPVPPSVTRPLDRFGGVLGPWPRPGGGMLTE